MNTQFHLNPELQSQLLASIDQYADAAWRDKLRRCAPQIIALVCDSHDQPVRHLQHPIRELIVEHCLCGAGQNDADPHTVDRHVKLVLAELEKLRGFQITAGDWSDAPVPPQMFG
ncbi:MAG: hypothetical protein GC162_13500 [Planctomycetes bacterium]|nr:hypothetical protein [Planctomycetota bacterium]